MRFKSFDNEDFDQDNQNNNNNNIPSENILESDLNPNLLSLTESDEVEAQLNPKDEVSVLHNK